MKLSLLDLQKTFSNRAYWTNTLINSAILTGLGVLEETITNVNLIEIELSHKDFIVTKQFTRKEEGSESGADWLWFIGEPGCWFPLLVQAKIINPKTSMCFYLNYRRGEQRNLLLKFASQYKLFPLYCIYSHISETFQPYSQLAPLLMDLNSKEWACSFVSPKQIQNLVKLKRRTQVDLLYYGIPWSFLFKFAANHEELFLGNAIAEAFLSVDIEFSELTIGKNNTPFRKEGNNRKDNKQTIRLRNRNPIDFLTPLIPKRFINLLKSDVFNKPFPLAGLGIISSIPIKEVLE
jgi:hypothetical protein